MAEEFIEKTENATTLANNAKKRKMTKLEKWFRTLRRVYFSVSWLMPNTKYGCQKKFNDRSYLIISNHKSVLDVIPPVLVTDKPVYYMAKKEIFDKRIGKWFANKCECISVNRDGNDVRAIMQAMKRLKEGSVVCIFPEGTRNKTEEMFLPFKSGAASLAIKTKTPIIPIVHIRKITFFRRIKFYCGEPFELTEFYDKKLTQEDMERADGILLQKMTELYCELKNLTSKKKKNNGNYSCKS